MIEILITTKFKNYIHICFKEALDKNKWTNIDGKEYKIQVTWQDRKKEEEEETFDKISLF